MNNILLIKYISIEDWDWVQSPIPNKQSINYFSNYNFLIKVINVLIKNLNFFNDKYILIFGDN